MSIPNNAYDRYSLMDQLDAIFGTPRPAASMNQRRLIDAVVRRMNETTTTSFEWRVEARGTARWYSGYRQVSVTDRRDRTHKVQAEASVERVRTTCACGWSAVSSRDPYAEDIVLALKEAQKHVTEAQRQQPMRLELR